MVNVFINGGDGFNFGIGSNYFNIKFAGVKLLVTFATHGGLAQLARAFAWHARGHRFDSDILHIINRAFRVNSKSPIFFYKIRLIFFY